MKKHISIPIMFAYITVSTLMSCVDFEKKATATANSTVKPNVAVISEEYTTDIEGYKREMREEMAINDRMISDFRSKVDDTKPQTQANCRKKLIEMSQKNSHLKKNLDDYKEGGRENWEKFKAESSYDMQELGKSLKDFNVFISTTYENGKRTQ